MLQTLQWRKWMLVHDAGATRRMYEARARTGTGKASCSCPWCRNFHSTEQRGPVFPDEVEKLFDSLGVNPWQEAELLCPGPRDSGLYAYTGYLGFVGRLESGPDAQPFKERKYEAVTDHFSIGFTRRNFFWSTEFEGQPTVEVRYNVDVPWVLSEPDPDAARVTKRKALHRQTRDGSG